MIVWGLPIVLVSLLEPSTARHPSKCAGVQTWAGSEWIQIPLELIFSFPFNPCMHAVQNFSGRRLCPNEEAYLKSGSIS